MSKGGPVRWQRVSTTGEVLAGVGEGVGHLVLNRPRAINALTPAMIDALAAQLSAWAFDDRIERVVLTGAGERGLCSGADVRALRELALAGDPGADRFFRHEYRLNALIASYPKPYEARMSGITTGGGHDPRAGAGPRPRAGYVLRPPPRLRRGRTSAAGRQGPRAALVPRTARGREARRHQRGARRVAVRDRTTYLTGRSARPHAGKSARHWRSVRSSVQR